MGLVDRVYLGGVEDPSEGADVLIHRCRWSPTVDVCSLGVIQAGD